MKSENRSPNAVQTQFRCFKVRRHRFWGRGQFGNRPKEIPNGKATTGDLFKSADDWSWRHFTQEDVSSSCTGNICANCSLLVNKFLLRYLNALCGKCHFSRICPIWMFRHPNDYKNERSHLLPCLQNKLLNRKSLYFRTLKFPNPRSEIPSSGKHAAFRNKIHMNEWAVMKTVGSPLWKAIMSKEDSWGQKMSTLFLVCKLVQ